LECSSEHLSLSPVRIGFAGPSTKVVGSKIHTVKRVFERLADPNNRSYASNLGKILPISRCPRWFREVSPHRFPDINTIVDALPLRSEGLPTFSAQVFWSKELDVLRAQESQAN